MRQLKWFILSAFILTLAACAQNHFIPYTDLNPDGTTIDHQQKPQYLKADRSPPRYQEARKQCVTANGHEVCGYNCKVSGYHAKCASNAKQRCVVGPYGNIVCGYDCKTTHSQAACGKYLYDNCVTSATGRVLCGNNCREREDGALICGK